MFGFCEWYSCLFFDFVFQWKRMKIKVFQALEIVVFPCVWQISLGNVGFSSDWKNSFFKILEKCFFQAIEKVVFFQACMQKNYCRWTFVAWWKIEIANFCMMKNVMKFNFWVTWYFSPPQKKEYFFFLDFNTMHIYICG